MNLNLKGQVYVVAGSSRGIGKAIATALLREDAYVVLSGRDCESLETTLSELSSTYGENVTAVSGDLSSRGVITQVESETLRRWGRIDGVVANAGAVKPVGSWRISDEEWDWYFSANFKIAYRIMECFIPHLIDSRGSAVLIGSIAGIKEIGAPLPYSTAKAALAMYAKGLARILAPDGVRVNVVNPGNVYFKGGNWEQRLNADPEGVRKYLKDNVPLDRFATPEDIAASTIFLLSDQAKFITGSAMVVDGGQISSLM